ncbi:MAG: twin-arginine translocase subunit TatC [Sedimentisphaerales bacterium]|nr:twin-arginine translocase subunit TatC [Sedimentisphaerales bacterium]HNY78843.1 twin-arginine translocase subunit TatC [Sedimentisphaerales bacterium]HOC63001.1 twin-arginine translocase subunit TatC [Sedimentisphaerales bacterium]HOH64782.1 twin-arginine translocase subunit TatC [Sedimentisphaerales bacterium]HPY49213.1 twin-arginine translocase subunit TatC [Sedimentisphaerales bacterium]
MKNHDPLSCTMSLGDHLEELRARLILAILGLVIGSVIALIFGTHILRFIERPYYSTMGKRFQDTEVPEMQAEILSFLDLFFTGLTEKLATDPNAPAIDPNRVAFIRDVSADAVKAWTKQVYGAGEGRRLPDDARLKVLGIPEAFTAYMKIAFISGLILTCPWVFYQLWMFVAAGLYAHERRYVRQAVPFSAALFIIGALFFLFVVAPLTLKFFLAFNDIVGVAANWTLEKYISFVTVLMLVFGLAFQTPIAIFILVRTGLVALKTLREVRKYVILVTVIVAAVVTPPDVISQIMLAIPLYALYELGLLLAHLSLKKAEKKKEDDRATAPPHRD